MVRDEGMRAPCGGRETVEVLMMSQAWVCCCVVATYSRE